MTYDPHQMPPAYPQQPAYPAAVSGPPHQYAPPPGYPQPAYGPPPVQPKKKWGAGKIVIAAVGGITALCVGGTVLSALAGSDTDKTTGSSGSAAKPVKADEAGQDESPFDMEVGSTLSRTNGDGEQQVTVTSLEFKKTCGGISEPKLGGYLVVNVITTQESGTGSINPLFFGFVGTDGATADSFSGIGSGCEKNNLDSTNSLRAGQKRSGQVVFDVASPVGSIEFTPGIGADSVGSWRVQ